MSDLYDELPYVTYPEPRTHPDRLGELAWLGGLDPAPPSDCRVLELGGGDAGNLAPMAAYLPGSSFVSVERATGPHESALETRRALGLDNLTCVRADLERLDVGELGAFDYVIAHGLLSWIAAPAREALLAVAARALAPDGVFVVSYNVKPAWGIRGALRDAMRLAVEAETDLHAKVEAARGVIHTLREELGRPTDPYRVVLARDLDFLAEQPGFFILHGLLAEENRPFSVAEVISLAARHGLRFAGELAEIGVDQLDGRARRERLVRSVGGGAAGDDAPAYVEPAYVEQLCDVLERRAFRMSAFVRRGAGGEPRSTEALARSGRVAGRLIRHPDGRFGSFNRVRITPRSQGVSHALAQVAASFPEGVPFSDLGLEAERDVADVVRLVEAGHLVVRRDAPRAAARVTERPRAHPFVRASAALEGLITGPFHERAPLDDLTRQLAIACTGEVDLHGLTLLSARAAGRSLEELRQPVRRRLEGLQREGLLAPD